MVVKASTKPWPRQLGSSIFRALPPLVKPGRVRPSKVKSSQGRGRGGTRRRGRASRGAGSAHRAGQAKSRRARVVPFGTRRRPASEERLSVGGPAGVHYTHPPCVTSGRGKPSRVKSSQARPGRPSRSHAAWPIRAEHALSYLHLGDSDRERSCTPVRLLRGGGSGGTHGV